MRPARLLTWIVGGLVVANLALWTARRVVLHDGEGPGPRSAWGRLTADERARYLELYRALERDADPRTVLGAARQFAQAPPARQDLLRELQRRIAESFARQPAGRRRDLLLAAPSARAFFVYQDWLAADPNDAARLAERVRAAAAAPPGSQPGGRR